MTKIAIDVRMINHSGIGTYMRNLLNVLVEDYHLILLGNPSEIQKHINSDKIEIIEFYSHIYSISEQIIFSLKIPNCDIFLSPHYNIPLFPIRAKKRIVIINDANHLAFYDQLSLKQKFYSKFMMKAAVNKSDRIIAISEFTKSEILKYLNVDHKKISVVHFGIDPSLIESELIDDNLSFNNFPPQYLLYVGNIKPHKNLINLLKAFEIFLSSHNDYKLIIIGKKEGFITGDNEVFKMVENNSLLKDNIIFTGYVENKELYHYYKSASIFVFPSLYEGFGIPPLEAMICGCPVIASNLTAIPEICGDVILYVNPLEPKDIAEKVNTLIDNKNLREELIKKGKLHVTKFSLAKFSHNLKDVIKEVINKG